MPSVPAFPHSLSGMCVRSGRLQLRSRHTVRHRGGHAALHSATDLGGIVRVASCGVPAPQARRSQ